MALRLEPGDGRYLIVTDIHGNLPALEAVLQSPEARRCDRVISLGDHVNFGPQPRETQQALMALNAVLLMGNHEERFRHINDPAFDGYNWRMLHWTYAALRGLPLTFPTDVQVGGVWCTHGTPGDPYHLVDAQSVCPELERLPEGFTLLLSGHHHIPWQVWHQGRCAFNPGSLGMNENGKGGLAPFAVLTVCGSAWRIQRHTVPYDPHLVRRAYLTSGCAEAAPEMARNALTTMETGAFHLMPRFVRHVAEVARAEGLDPAGREAWRLADLRWPWPEPVDSVTWWKAQRVD